MLEQYFSLDRMSVKGRTPRKSTCKLRRAVPHRLIRPEIRAMLQFIVVSLSPLGRLQCILLLQLLKRRQRVGNGGVESKVESFM